MMSKQYYKVVKYNPDLDVFYSFNSGVCSEQTALYRIGEWTYAPERYYDMGYGLMVFDTRLHAAGFCGSLQDISRVFVCEIDTPVWTPQVPSILPTSRFDAFLRYFNELWYTFSDTDRVADDAKHCWPDGTLMVHGVKLLEEITTWRLR